MKRLVSLTGLALGIALSASAARASGDYGCSPSWKLFSNVLSPCDNSAVLSPGNDTRVNLFHLTRTAPPPAGLTYAKDWDDRSLGHTFFSWGLLRRTWFGEAPEEADNPRDGSRCVSLASGAESFAAAIKASAGLPAGEKTALSGARARLTARCDGQSAAEWPEIKTAPGREYLGYLQAADAFYAEDWASARQGFARLRAVRDPWLAETGAYMLGRTELNAAQANSFDEYGSFAGPEKSDRSALTSARAGFEDYLKRYPTGRYVASARGLLRRIMWLGGDVGGLTREYERLLAGAPKTGPAAADLVEEIDNKLLTASYGRQAIDAPLLLATVDLRLMRDAEASGQPQISAMELAAQESRFAGRADLFGFVTANHAFYVAKDMRRVLQLVPDDARQPAYAPLAFSRQVLRGMALAALRDRNEAGFWRELLGGADRLYQRPVVELALAMNYERSGKLADVFAAGSPIGEAAVREILLEQVAGPDLLRRQARDAARPVHERDVALFTLLYKQLTRGDFAGFGRDVALVRAGANTDAGFWQLYAQDHIPVGLFRKGVWSDGYACPALAQTVEALASNGADARARLCLGDFFRLNGFDYYEGDLSKPPANELGGTPSLFPGRAAYRGAIYAGVIADPRAGAPEKAYALYRAVNCYAPSGSNQCGGADVPKSQRQGWFQRLKTAYPQSEWAQKLRYYW